MNAVSDRSKLIAFLVALLVGIFGGFYSFIADLSSVVPMARGMSGTALIWLRIAISIGVFLAIAVVAFITVYLRQIFARRLGFVTVTDAWFPSETAERLDSARKILRHLVEENKWPIRLVSVTGEWDIARPFPEKEIKRLLASKNCAVKILLAHPESKELRRRCDAEDLDLAEMRSRIVTNTRYLMNVAPNRCHVRWYLSPSVFHVLANAEEMHFSPFVDGVPGHDTKRYVVASREPLFASIIRWFDDTWERALDPELELRWITRQVGATRAIFLDRDDTLIRDIAYFGKHDQVDIGILPGVIDGLRLLSNRGFRLIVISNQQPTGLKLNTERELALLTTRIKNLFAEEGVYFDAFYYCTHTVSQDCNCRKPKPQLFETAARDFCLDLRRCHFIGNSEADQDVASYIPEMPIHIVDEQDNFLSVARRISGVHWQEKPPEI